MPHSLRSYVIALFALFYATPSTAATMVASWYGRDFEGKTMADGRAFRADDPTIAAHRTLPLGTELTLTNPRNGRSVTVRVQDRGPYIRGRSLDVSRAAAVALGFARQGTAVLTVQTLSH